MADVRGSPIIDHVPGAVAVPDDDPLGRAGVAWHYGAPLVEQRDALAGRGVVDLGHRRVLRLTGADRVDYVNTLFSQLVGDEPTEALNLDPQGRVLHHMAITPTAGALYIDAEPAGFGELRDYLTRMIFRFDVQVAETGHHVLGILGADPDRWPEGCLPHPRRAMSTVLAPEDAAIAAWDALVAGGARPTGLMAWEAERVAGLRPEVAADLDAKAIPHEVPGWIGSAVHLDKGCYRGQETVSRVHNLGRPPRTLVLLQLDGSAGERPGPGDPVLAGRRAVGRVGTVVDHHEYGPVALALVKRSAQTAEGLTAGGCAVAVDPATVFRDDSPKPGRLAVDRLRGR